MFPKPNQKGFAIVGAIFLIVILAFLGVSMSRVLNTGQQAINQDISSLQAYFAGQSALQWGMYQAVLTKAATPITIDNNDEFSLSFSTEGLRNTKASILFRKNTILTKDYFKITATSDYGSDTSGNTEFSRRKLEVRFVP